MIRKITRRAWMIAASAAALVTPAQAEEAAFDAAVGDGPADTLHFETLAAAIAAAPIGGARPFRIFVGAGTWRGKLIVDRPNVHLIGAGPAQTILSFAAAAGMARPDGEPWGTRGCASLIVRARDFSARNLTIENSFDYIADLASPQFERIGSNGAQAVALMLDAGADRSFFSNVTILGHQDTLFADSGIGCFRDCTVAGSVDFIFGAGAIVFDRCELRSRFRPLMQRNHGWVCAPSTPRDQEFGFVFRDCRLTRETQTPPASVALGRPWRPARQFADGRYGDPGALAMAAFLDCWMDDHISADGWDEMGYPSRDGPRIFLQPGEARFGEHASTGPGAFANRRRPHLSARAAAAMTPARVLNNWRPG